MLRPAVWQLPLRAALPKWQMHSGMRQGLRQICKSFWTVQIKNKARTTSKPCAQQRPAWGLGRAQKQLREVLATIPRTKHLTDAIMIWENQLESYRQGQAQVCDQAARARANISAARRLISELNAQVGGTQAPPPPITAEETASEETDTERNKPQDALRAYANSLGVTRPKRSYRINQRRQPHQTRSEIETTNCNAPPILAKNAREHRPCTISFTNDLHEAMFCVSPFIHSVMWEVDYCSPNAVILNAWRLRWEVLAHECPAWQNDVHRSSCYQEPSYGFQPILFADVSQVPSDEHCRKRQIHFAESTY